MFELVLQVTAITYSIATPLFLLLAFKKYWSWKNRVLEPSVSVTVHVIKVEEKKEQRGLSKTLIAHLEWEVAGKLYTDCIPVKRLKTAKQVTELELLIDNEHPEHLLVKDTQRESFIFLLIQAVIMFPLGIYMLITFLGGH